MATEYGLQLKYKEEFHAVFEEHQEHPEFGPLMVRMKVVEQNGESSMNEDQWEAASECTRARNKYGMLMGSSPRYLYRICVRENSIIFKLVVQRAPYLRYNISIAIAFHFLHIDMGV